MSDFRARPAGCPDEIDALELYDGNWPSDKPFPLTPLEAWWLLQGYAVKPQAGITSHQVTDDLPGKFELFDGYLVLWRS